MSIFFHIITNMEYLTDKDIELLELINSYKPIGMPSTKKVFDEFDIPIYKLLLKGLIAPPVYTLTTAGELALSELQKTKEIETLFRI